MAFRLTWSPASRLDLTGLLSYIMESNPTTARNFARNVFKSVERLNTFPESGRIVPEFNDPLIREVICKPCGIVYRIKRKECLIEIVRVWHAARGIPEI